MKLLVKGKNTDVSDRVQSYAEKRLSKLSKQLPDDVTRVELEITHEKNPRVSNSHVAEATIWTKGPTLRAKEASPDVYASIDLVADKLMRQVKKYREKRLQYQHGNGHHGNGSGRYKGVLKETNSLTIAPTTPEQQLEEEYMAHPDTVNIVKTKQFQLGPMTPQEASLQMDLVGHDFFVFVNSENNQTCVLYKRADGDYGLIEPTLTEPE